MRSEFIFIFHVATTTSGAFLHIEIERAGGSFVVRIKYPDPAPRILLYFISKHGILRDGNTVICMFSFLVLILQIVFAFEVPNFNYNLHLNDHSYMKIGVPVYR